MKVIDSERNINYKELDEYANGELTSFLRSAQCSRI